MSYAKPKKSGVSITPEQLQAERVRFFAEKREQFAIGILCSLLYNNPGIHPDDVITKAVGLADGLMDKLYSLKAE